MTHRVGKMAEGMLRTLLLAVTVGSAAAVAESDATMKDRDGDPFSARNFVYWACDEDGVSACGSRSKAPLKIDPAAVNSPVALDALRDPDGWVKRVPAAEMDPTTFFNEFVVKHRPVVLTNVSTGWGATTKWSDAYIKEKLGGYTLRMETKDDDKYNIPDGLSPDEFFATYNTTRGRYLVDELPPVLHKDVGIPRAMQCDNITSQFFVSYLWMSAGGTASQTHVDTDENMMFVFAGQKVLTLIAPVFSSQLHADETRVMGVLDDNLAAIDLRKSPRMVDVRYVMAVVDPGDSVYLPQNWWHQVNSTEGHQLAVTTWWKSRPRQRAVPEGLGAAGRYFKGKRVRTSYATVLENYGRSVLTDTPQFLSCTASEEPRTMADFEFATDREDFVREGDPSEWYESPRDDSKAGRDEELWCPFRHDDARSPCYFRGCAAWISHAPDGDRIARETNRRDREDADYAAVVKELTADGASERQEERMPAPPDDGPGGGGTSYRCIRYILDYCHAKLTDDPQCWVELSNFMTKVSQTEVKVLRRKRSELPRPGVLNVPSWADDAQARFERESAADREEWQRTWQLRHAKEHGVDASAVAGAAAESRLGHGGDL